MRSTTFLRIASLVTLFYFVGHSSGYPWTPSVEPADLAIIEAMKGHSFDVVGSLRSFWDFYVGFGITISLLILALAVVLWQLGSMAKADPARVRNILATLFAAFLINTVISVRYFFIIPTVTSAVITLCVGLALVTARDRETMPSLPRTTP